jgi:hypothetical protein
VLVVLLFFIAGAALLAGVRENAAIADGQLPSGKQA